MPAEGGIGVLLDPIKSKKSLAGAAQLPTLVLWVAHCCTSRTPGTCSSRVQACWRRFFRKQKRAPPSPPRRQALRAVKTDSFVRFVPQSRELRKVKLLRLSLAPVQSKLLGGSLVCSDGGKHHFWGFFWQSFWLSFIEL